MKNIRFFLPLAILAISITACVKEDLQKLTPSEAINDADFLQIDPSEGLLDEAGLLQLLGETAIEDRASGQSVVYTMSNEVAANEVIAFNRNSDGTLYEAGRYPTGGTGTGGGLGNQGALAISSGGKFLYVVNPGSNELSHLLIKNDGSLMLLNKVPSGGMMPVSVAVYNGLVYVLNAGGTGNITGFAFNQQGQMMQLTNSTRALSSPAAGAAQVSFKPNGKALVVTEKATNTISSFAVLSDGRTGNIRTFPSANATPFGFAFGNNGNFHVSEAAGGAANASSVSSYFVSNNGYVSLVDGPFLLNQSAACWVVLTKNSQRLFTTNTASNNLSTLKVSQSGQLSFGNGGNPTPAMSGPIDAAIDGGSDYLYILANGNNALLSYSIDNNGQLTQIDTDDENLPDRMSGLVVRF